MRNAAERSFWTFANHQPDGGKLAIFDASPRRRVKHFTALRAARRRTFHRFVAADTKNASNLLLSSPHEVGGGGGKDSDVAEITP
jgi:hypothetical protein